MLNYGLILASSCIYDGYSRKYNSAMLSLKTMFPIYESKKEVVYKSKKKTALICIWESKDD